jgi:hypothetical protein
MALVPSHLPFVDRPTIEKLEGKLSESLDFCGNFLEAFGLAPNQYWGAGFADSCDG